MKGRVFLLAVAAALAQQTSATFTDAGGHFQFRYPPWLRLFTQSNIGQAALLSYIPLCEPQAIACVVEPASEYKGTNLEGMSFQVLRTSAPNEAACLKTPDGSQLTSERTIHSMRFEHGSTDTAAAGHSMFTELYRTWHAGVCYEARLSSTQISIAIAPAGTHKLSKIEEERSQNRMGAIFDSLQFLTP